MPTPVGPVPSDPNDPDLWDEWYDGDDDEAGPEFGWPLRLIALLIVGAMVALFILAE
jgi:hypothetical protein